MSHSKIEFRQIKFDDIFFKKAMLSCGAHLKNTFCLAKGSSLFLSSPIGDLDSLEAVKNFEKTIPSFVKRFNIVPQVIAYDLHPEYLSTKYALDYPGRSRRIGVQHHHAHIVSCLADNIEQYNPNTKVIGVAFDGTGLGPDGTLWGGEFIVANFKDYKRVAHLKYIALPGGEIAIPENYRTAFSILYRIFGKDMRKLNIEWLKNKQSIMLAQMLDKNINCPLSSSAGRLFDAVSAILGICLKASYQAQAAIELEKVASRNKFNALESYPFKTIKENGIYVVDYDIMIKQILQDIRHRLTKFTIAYKFHITVGRMILEACKRIRRSSGLNQVALSGGVFQNKILFNQTVSSLKKNRFSVFTHQQLPTNDGSISVGQAIIANTRI